MELSNDIDPAPSRPILLPFMMSVFQWGMRGMRKSGAFFSTLWRQNHLPSIHWTSVFSVELPPIYFITVLSILFVLLLFRIAYIKWRHPFWNLQPVYHTYDFWRRWYASPFIIHASFQEKYKNKYYQPWHVSTLDFTYLTEDYKKEMTDLLQCYFKLSEQVYFTMSASQIECYMGGHSHPSYISFYLDTHVSSIKRCTSASVKKMHKHFILDERIGLYRFAYELSNGHIRSSTDISSVRRDAQYSISVQKETDPTQTQTQTQTLQDISASTYVSTSTNVLPRSIPIACMVSYPIYILSTAHRIATFGDSHPLVANHWDFISVKREYNPKKIHRPLLQTHEYFVRKQNPAIPVSSFQQEYRPEEGIMPLVRYTNTLYQIQDIPVYPLPVPITIERIYEKNTDVLLDWITDMRSMKHTPSTFLFEIACLHDTSTLLTLLKNHMYFIYLLREADTILALYFMKDTHTVYDIYALEDETPSKQPMGCRRPGNILQLLSSVKISRHLSHELMVAGFLHCIQDMNKNVHKKYPILSISDIAHNSYLLPSLHSLFLKIEMTEQAFYLYNYFYPRSSIPSSSYFSMI